MPEKKYLALKTNIPMIGTISKVWYSHPKSAQDKGWVASLKLVGNWEGETLPDLYVPIGVLPDMEKAGFLSEDRSGPEPLYQVMMPNTMVQFLKEEKGTKKYTTFSLVGGEQEPQDSPEPTKSEQPAITPDLRKMMAEIETKYAACLAMSAYRHVTLYACPTINLDMRSVQAGAATMMIEMSRHGVKPTPAMLKALMERLKDASLAANVDDPLEVQP